jgi:hypothetical protein
MLRMEATLLRASALFLAAAVAGCGNDDDGPSGPGPGTSDFEWSGQIAQGLAIEIKGISGSISASLASGNDVEVFATKEGQQSNPATVTIEVVEHAGGVTICAVYPDVAGEPPNECAPGLQGNMSNQGNDVEVTFAVLVPEGVSFVGRTVSGNVNATSLRSEAFAYIVSGSADIVTTTIAEASTVSGSIDVTLGDGDPPRDLSFTTVSGNVTLRIPASTNAEIRATFVTGSVSSDFPLTETLPGVWEATLGSGGNTLSLSTVSGSVALRSGP